MKTYKPNNYYQLFENNSNYFDPKGNLSKKEFYFLILWVHGFSQFAIRDLFRMKISMVKQIEGQVFDALKLKFKMPDALDYRGLIPLAMADEMLTKENTKLPPEVLEWIEKRKPKKKRVQSA